MNIEKQIEELMHKFIEAFYIKYDTEILTSMLSDKIAFIGAGDNQYYFGKDLVTSYLNDCYLDQNDYDVKYDFTKITKVGDNIYQGFIQMSLTSSLAVKTHERVTFMTEGSDPILLTMIHFDNPHEGIRKITHTLDRNNYYESLNRELGYSLAKNYYAIYILDLTTSMMTPLRVPEDITSGLDIIHLPDISIGNYVDRLVETKIHPDDRDYVMEIFDIEHLRSLVRSGKKTEEYDYRRHMGGKYKWVRLFVMFNIGDNQAILCYRDISDEKELEKERKAREKRFGSILKVSYDTIYSIFPDKDEYSILLEDGKVHQHKNMLKNFERHFNNYVETKIHPDYKDIVYNSIGVWAMKSRGNSTLKSVNVNNEELSCRFRINKPEEVWEEIRLVYMDDVLNNEVILLKRDITVDVKLEREVKEKIGKKGN